MTTESDDLIARHVQEFVASAALLAIIAGVAVLVGWVLDVASLKSILPSWGAMKANAALCFILIGIGSLAAACQLTVVNSRHSKLLSRVSGFCALLVGLVSSLTLGEYFFDWTPGIDQWLFHESSGAMATSHPGRMAPESALCFLLLASAILLDLMAQRRRAITVTSIAIGLTVTTFALAAILSYLTPQLGVFGWFGLTIMAMHTAVLFALLGAAIAALSWLKNVAAWALGLQVSLMIALGLLALVFSSLTLSRTQSWLLMSNRQMVWSEQIQDRADLLLARVVQANGDLRSYVLTGDNHYLKSYRSSAAAIEANLTALHLAATESGTAAERSSLAGIERLLEQQGDWEHYLANADPAKMSHFTRIGLASQTADRLNTFLDEFRAVQATHRQHIDNLQQISVSVSSISARIILGTTFVSMLFFLLALLRLNYSEVLRQRVAQSLASNEVRYRSVVQSAGDAIVTADGAGIIVGWNRAAETVFGYEEAEIIGQPLTLLMPEHYREQHQAGMKRVQSGAGTRIIGNTAEFKGLRKDGSEFPMELSLVKWADGEAAFFTGTMRDVTVRKLAENQLRKLSQAVEQSPESIVITNLDPSIEYVNEAFVRTTGYCREEVIGCNPRMLHSGKTPPENYVSLWRALTSGQSWQGEFCNRRKDGSEYTEYASVSPLRQPDGQITHYIAIKQDITEHKRALDAIHESKMLLQRVIDSTPDWIFVKDQNHRFLLANEPFARAFDQTPQSMVGREDIDFLPAALVYGNPDENLLGLHDYDEAVFRGESVHLPYEKISFGNGKEKIFETFKTPLKDASDVIYGNLCYRRDITERFGREQEQRSLEQQLQQAQKLDLIGQLTGGIAHDFNNILASMLGFAEILQMSPDLQKNPKMSRYVEEILQSGIRAKELIAQLLIFSQKRELASEAIAVSPIVTEVSKLLRATLPASITIDTFLSTDLPEVLISPVQLHQILMNLGINARDAMNGKGSLKIGADAAVLDELNICASCHMDFSGRYLMISVQDSGCGIPLESVSKIFDPFFTTKEVGRGSGLGLSVLHGIVHSANGHIDVITELGKGTEIRVYLPVSSTQVRPSTKTSDGDKKEPVSIHGHVMVVDDEETITYFLTDLLQLFGCRVTAMNNPTKALQVFRDNPDDVDLIITDFTMPEMTGTDLARAMLAIRNDIPIVLNTGYSHGIDEKLIREIGICRILIKPVPAQVIEDVIVELLQGKTVGAGSSQDI